jgi:hypothetical protein
MTTILDTVEPDSIADGFDRDVPLYSRETVERLLAERDAEVASLKKRLGEQNQKIYGIALQLRQDAASDPYDDRDTCPKWLAQRMRDAADKLRRIAEGEK